MKPSLAFDDSTTIPDSDKDGITDWQEVAPNRPVEVAVDNEVEHSVAANVRFHSVNRTYASQAGRPSQSVTRGMDINKTVPTRGMEPDNPTPQASIAYSYKKKIPEGEARYIRVIIQSGQSVIATKNGLTYSLHEEKAKEIQSDDTSTVEGFSLPWAKYFFIKLTYDTSVFKVTAERPDTQQLNMQGKIEWRWRVFGKIPVTQSEISLDVFSSDDKDQAFQFSSETIPIQVEVKANRLHKVSPVPSRYYFWQGLIVLFLLLAGVVVWLLRKRKKQSEKKIYFSYAWIDEPGKAAVVNQMYDSLKKDSFNVLRDKVDLKYRGSITTFMEDIGKADLAIIIISDKYLKSKFCMFELFEIYLNAAMDVQNFRRKIFPVMLENIDLSSLKVQRQYIDYWEANESELELLLKNNINTLTDEQVKQLQVIRRIVDEIGIILPVLSDLNALTIEKLLENDFAEMKVAIRKAIHS